MSDKPIAAKPGLYAYYYAGLKEIAYKYGYNLIVNGSMNRDLDLIAIPWINGAQAIDKEKMIDEFMLYIGHCHLLSVDQEKEIGFQAGRFGRKSVVINIERGGKHNNYKDLEYYIDISFVPIDELYTALNELVELKIIKDTQGKTDDYERRQPLAWKKAFSILNKPLTLPTTT